MKIMKAHSKLRFLLVGFMICHFVRGQDHSYVHYDVHEGLAGATVYCMAQDRSGFIWIGTETGLSRFDGTHFKNFTTQDGLPDNEILKLFVDSKNRVWFSPFKNQVGYYEDGKFHTQKNDSILRKLKIKSTIERIVEDKAGNIMLSEAYAVHMILTDGRINYFDPLFHPHGAFFAAGVNANGQFRVLAVKGNGVCWADYDGKAFRQVRNFKASMWNSSLIDHIDPDLEVIQDRGHIVFYNPIDSQEFRLRVPAGFTGVLRCNSNAVVVNTFTNSYFVDLRRKMVTDSFLNGKSVNSVLEDSEGGIWFGTISSGVYKLTSADVGNYVLKLRNSDQEVFSIQELDSNLYIGGDHNVLGIVNLRTRRLDCVQIHDSSGRGRIVDILPIGSHTLLMGTDHCTYELDTRSKKFLFHNWPESVKTYYKYGDSMVLMSSNMHTRTIRLRDMAIVDTIWMGRTTCSYRSRDGLYYLGTLEGLYTMRKGERPYFAGVRDSVLANRIVAIKEGWDDILWIATNGDGVAGYRHGKVVRHITMKNGLSSNICRAMYVTGKDIWIGTDRGLNKIAFTGDTFSVTNYSMSDGLNADVINAVYADGDDVYVGTTQGMDVFNEKKISKRSRCILRLTGISVSDRQLKGDTTGLALSHKDNNIRFDFVGISFKSSGDILYRYRLVGLDTGWKTTRDTYLSYPSLPSGSYELQLIAINKFGVSSRQASVLFSVDKLLWEQWWFRLLILFSVAASVFFYFNYRIRLIRKKEAEKLEINSKIAELEQMALRSQMNPHFIFNCLNSIQQYVLYRDVLGANEFITKFSYLIRQTLDLSARKAITIQEEMTYVETYMSLEKRRFDNKFVYEMVAAPDVDRLECHIPPMILQPYIENAIRHGIGLRQDNLGRLLVRIYYSDGALVCMVEDNGVGRKIARQFKSRNSIAYQSVGMSLVAKRIEMINKTSQRPVEIYIEDMEDPAGSPLGTRICIYFPLEIALASGIQ